MKPRTARTTSIGLPKTPSTLFREYVGWTPQRAPNYPTRSPHIPILLEGSRTTSPLAAPSPRCTLPPSDRVVPARSPVHWYMQHPSHSAPLLLHKTEHVSITG